MRALAKHSIDAGDLQLIGNLYWRQRMNVKIGATTMEKVCPTERGVRQGCPLAPRLFNLYADEITRHRTFKNAGLRVNGRRINIASATRTTKF